MTRLFINGREAALKDNTSFEYVVENRLFSDSDGYSFSIELPLHGCPANREIFGYIDRRDVDAGHLKFDAEIIAGRFTASGIVTVVSVSEAEVSVQFLEGRSVQNFDDFLSKIYINELELGKYSPSISVPPAEAWGSALGPFNLPDAVALPWVNASSGNMQNAEHPVKTEIGTVIGNAWDKETTGLSYMPYLYTIAVRICKAVKYSFDFSEWERSFVLRALLCCNVLPEAWGIYEFARALPHWTVEEFFRKLELLLSCEFDIDPRHRRITMRFTHKELFDAGEECIDTVTDVYTKETGDGDDNDSKYAGCRNLAFKDCDHEMWKYYSCQWFVEQMKHGVVRYKTLKELVDQNKYAHYIRNWNRNQTAQKLLYAEDVDMYFVVRAVDKTLTIEYTSRPNVYTYRCVLQPVNPFGPYIAPGHKEDDDTDECDFVPAWLDVAEESRGNCLFVPVSSYEEPENGVENDTEVDDPTDDIIAFKKRVDEAFYQPQAAARLEAGAKEKKAEYFDRIYVAFWPALVSATSEYACPILTQKEVDSHWNIINHTYPYTLRFNSPKSGLQSRWRLPESDPAQKETYSFISDTIPNVRARFLIHGRYFICGKLTATFTQSGMSQLIKGEFYPIND